jgi:anhydro-N-acetylmuramic acid kinase
MTAIRVTLHGQVHHAIGLMSGTSHDGISAALVRIDRRLAPPLKLLAFRTYPYPDEFRTRLLEASAGGKVGADAIAALNFVLGEKFAKVALSLMRSAGLPKSRLGFIGSHGHTVSHLPPRRAARDATPSTLQLGESAVIAALTGVPVVADFRPMDIALGGEGAPLAPLAHLWLFRDRKRGRVIQNIGGIGNATYIPPGAHERDARLVAFDTGPGVMVIDALARRLSGGRMRMDRNGLVASQGSVNERLLARLMRHSYFRRKPPKSTGREEFGEEYMNEVQAAARRLSLDNADLMATVTALTARSIAGACRRFLAPLGRIDQLIATGGGARNPALMRMIAAELPTVEVLAAERLGINGEALEAIAFVILAYRMLRGRPGNVPSVTGASSPAILGKLTMPPKPSAASRG